MHDNNFVDFYEVTFRVTFALYVNCPVIIHIPAVGNRFGQIFFCVFKLQSVVVIVIYLNALARQGFSVNNYNLITFGNGESVS